MPDGGGRVLGGGRARGQALVGRGQREAGVGPTKPVGGAVEVGRVADWRS